MMSVKNHHTPPTMRPERDLTHAAKEGRKERGREDKKKGKFGKKGREKEEMKYGDQFTVNITSKAIIQLL